MKKEHYLDLRGKNIIQTSEERRLSKPQKKDYPDFRRQ
jgi:hypothetical protein